MRWRSTVAWSRTIDLKSAIRFPFMGDKRWANLGCALVCFLIPIIGPIVLIGYGTLVEKQLIENIHAAARPFDFGRFTDYLKRGVAPFVVSLIAVPLLWIVMIPAIVLVGLGIFISDRMHSDLILIIAIAAEVLLFLAVILAAPVLLAPINLKAALEQTIAGAFERNFVLGFLRRVGLAYLGYNSLLTLGFVLAMPFSLCIPFVGMYLLAAIFLFVQWHMQAQFYLLYLERGGAPLRIAQDLPLPAFPVVPPLPQPPPPAPPPAVQ